MADTQVLKIRPVRREDLDEVVEVESLSTPKLRYVGEVFDMFASDPRGEFMVAQFEGRAVGIAKFTVLPDGSGWLEALRVRPDQQGRGIGKALYERLLQAARAQGVATLRMYTGAANRVSRGLAERFGFALEETFLGYAWPAAPVPEGAQDFRAVTDGQEAADLLLPNARHWGHFLVRNRTFYPLTEALCRHLAERGEVFRSGQDVVVLGARFGHAQGLHLGMFSGDQEKCIGFAQHRTFLGGAGTLHCLFPSGQEPIRASLEACGFQSTGAPFLVMKRG